MGPILIYIYHVFQIVEAALLKENIFITNLLRWLPLPLQSKEPELETKSKLNLVQ